MKREEKKKRRGRKPLLEDPEHGWKEDLPTPVYDSLNVFPDRPELILKHGPDDITPELWKELIESILRGANRKQACMAVGISARTLKDWEQKASADEAKSIQSARRAFIYALKIAEAHWQNYCVYQIDDLARKGKGTWTGFMTMLERRNYPVWGQKSGPGDDTEQPVSFKFRLTERKTVTTERIMEEGK